MEASDNSSDAMVLLHTLPPGTDGPRAEEAVFRQYNSCVDFTFQERRGHNARELSCFDPFFHVRGFDDFAVTQKIVINFLQTRG